MITHPWRAFAAAVVAMALAVILGRALIVRHQLENQPQQPSACAAFTGQLDPTQQQMARAAGCPVP